MTSRITSIRSVEMFGVYTGEEAGILFDYVKLDNYWQTHNLEVILQGDYVSKFSEIPESGPIEPPADDPRWPFHNQNHIWGDGYSNKH